MDLIIDVRGYLMVHTFGGDAKCVRGSACLLIGHVEIRTCSLESLANRLAK